MPEFFYAPVQSPAARAVFGAGSIRGEGSRSQRCTVKAGRQAVRNSSERRVEAQLWRQMRQRVAWQQRTAYTRARMPAGGTLRVRYQRRAMKPAWKGRQVRAQQRRAFQCGAQEKAQCSAARQARSALPQCKKCGAQARCEAAPVSSAKDKAWCVVCK